MKSGASNADRTVLEHAKSGWLKKHLGVIVPNGSIYCTCKDSGSKVYFLEPESLNGKCPLGLAFFASPGNRLKGTPTVKLRRSRVLSASPGTRSMSFRQGSQVPNCRVFRASTLGIVIMVLGRYLPYRWVLGPFGFWHTGILTVARILFQDFELLRSESESWRMWGWMFLL